MNEKTYTDVASADAIEDRSFATFAVGGVALVICRHGEDYYALENLCSHASATFDDGRLRGFQLFCPLHGGSFDIRDGCPKSAPARKPIRVFDSRVVDGRVQVALDAG